MAEVGCWRSSKMVPLNKTTALTGGVLRMVTPEADREEHTQSGGRSVRVVVLL